MDKALLELLRTVDTPTVCNAIEVVQGKRGFANFTRTAPFASEPQAPAIVGYAVTAKIAAAEPSREPVETVRQRRMAYYKMMAEAPKPSIAVVQDLDYPAATGAYWGELNATVHQGFGMAGVLTNGLVRDLGDLPNGFPILAGSTGPSHAFVHVREIDTSVEIFDLTTKPGDLIHADRHGALVIPPETINGLSAGINQLLATERIVLDAARRPDFDFAIFEEAWAAFEKART